VERICRGRLVVSVIEDRLLEEVELQRKTRVVEVD
jgi:hypothetical protein